jgi:hypothetical protein
MNFQEWKKAQRFGNQHPDLEAVEIPQEFQNEPEVKAAIKKPSVRYGSTKYILPDGVYLFSDGVECIVTEE